MMRNDLVYKNTNNRNEMIREKKYYWGEKYCNSDKHDKNLFCIN